MTVPYTHVHNLHSACDLMTEIDLGADSARGLGQVVHLGIYDRVERHDDALGVTVW